MSKLRSLFEQNTKVITDLSITQAIELANIVFCNYKRDRPGASLLGSKQIVWEVKRHDKTGYWLNGIDKLGMKYYFRINEYFEIYESLHIPSDKEGEIYNKYEGHMGKIDLSWEYGVPYINVVSWFFENGFNIFTRYPKNK